MSDPGSNFATSRWSVRFPEDQEEMIVVKTGHVGQEGMELGGRARLNAAGLRIAKGRYRAPLSPRMTLVPNYSTSLSL